MSRTNTSRRRGPIGLLLVVALLFLAAAPTASQGLQIPEATLWTLDPIVRDVLIQVHPSPLRLLPPAPCTRHTTDTCKYAVKDAAFGEMHKLLCMLRAAASSSVAVRDRRATAKLFLRV